MNWIGIVLVVVGVWLALKVAGALVKMLLWLASGRGPVVAGAPLVGLPLVPFI